MAEGGRFGEGVLGPFEEGADVNDDKVSPLVLVADAMELTRGEYALEEYAAVCGRRGSAGRCLSVTYGGR